MKPLLAGFVVVLVCSITSCTKTDNVKTTVYDTVTQVFKDTTVVRDTVYSQAKNPIVGLWVGTFQVDGNTVDSFYYSFNIHSNGQMITGDIYNNGSASSAGPWQLSGTSFSATLSALDNSGGVQSVTATYDSVAGTLKGVNNYIQGTGLNTNFLLLRIQ